MDQSARSGSFARYHPEIGQDEDDTRWIRAAFFAPSGLGNNIKYHRHVHHSRYRGGSASIVTADQATLRSTINPTFWLFSHLRRNLSYIVGIIIIVNKHPAEQKGYFSDPMFQAGLTEKTNYQLISTSAVIVVRHNQYRLTNEKRWR